MKKFLIVLVAVLVLLMAAAGYLFFDANYIYLGQVYSRDVTELDLRGEPLSSPERLAELTQLKRLDLRDTGITPEQYQLLAQKLPGCQITWSVPFQGQHYSSDAQQLKITQLTQADIAQLAYFPQLTQVDAYGCADLAAIQTLRTQFPHLAVSYWVPLGEAMISPDADAVTLGDHTVQELAEALAYLPGVTQVDATGCHDYAGLQALQAQYPQCSFRYLVQVAGQEIPNTATSLTVQDPDLAQLGAVLPYLPELQTLGLTGALPTNQEIHTLQAAYPQVKFLWSFRLFGKEVSTDATELDFSNIPMESTQEIEAALPYFNNLERVVMCDCGISNQDMDQLGQRNPDIRFVWTVSIGPHIRLRTDATYLMPYQYGTKLTDSQTGNLKYCIDLVCIDLGHNSVSDISFLAYMPHMKYLLLAQTEVSDISACAGLQELEYVELFMSQVRDYSPLISCPNLRDLNICYAVPKDDAGVAILCQLTQLDNLYAKARWSDANLEKVRQALPNVNLVTDFSEVESSTGSGWRELPNYYKMRDFLGMHYMKG